MINRTIKKNIDGILLLNKDLEITSNAALQRVKRLFCAKKAGHTGSLDPKASGMLPICFGQATKFSQYLLESNKHYSVLMKLGVKTTTGDTEGEVILEKPVHNITPERIQEVLQKFLGEIQQIPPMFSAIKLNGKPLYSLARKGIEVERPARFVKIFELTCHPVSEDVLSLDVHCSKGTYVRTLVEDIGEALGTCAHVTKLHRVSVSPYQQSKMVTFAVLEKTYEEKGLEGLYEFLLPMDSSVQDLPEVNLIAASAFYIRTGHPIKVSPVPSPGLLRMYSEGTFIGIGEVVDKQFLAPRRLLAS